MKKPSENTSEKNKMKIIVNGHEVTLCFAEKAMNTPPKTVP